MSLFFFILDDILNSKGRNKARLTSLAKSKLRKLDRIRDSKRSNLFPQLQTAKKQLRNHSSLVLSSSYPNHLKKTENCQISFLLI